MLRIVPVITARRLQRAGEGLVEDGFLEFVEGGKFLFVDGFQALGFACYCMKL